MPARLSIAQRPRLDLYRLMFVLAGVEDLDVPTDPSQRLLPIICGDDHFTEFQLLNQDVSLRLRIKVPSAKQGATPMATSEANRVLWIVVSTVLSGTVSVSLFEKVITCSEPAPPVTVTSSAATAPS